MQKGTVYPKESVSFKDLEPFLKANDLVDSNTIWVAGYEDVQTNNHPVTRNLFYGYKRLHILTIKDSSIYHLANSKDGLRLKEIYTKNDISGIKVRRKILYPRIELIKSTHAFKLAVTKNKSNAAQFKHAF